MAERIIMKILAKKNLSVYQREETLFNLGVVYMEEGSDRMIDAAEKRLIQAAILCNRNAITKNSPFILLALLSANKDYKLAYRYITLATSDTSLFSIDHKVVTREKVYNLIQAIYNHEIKSQKTILQVVLSIVFLLSIIILFILIILYRMNLMLKKKSKELISLNNKLKNTNKMKEVYVGYFLNQYSIYIDKIIDYKKYVIRLINAGHPANTIKKEAMSFINTKEDLNDFFIDFDKSILELFPHFVQEVNELLQPEQRYKIQSNPNDSIERLNTELRILALLRLGIYDNKKIALFFRLTLQTVYNYRSKAKSRAINERSFEEKIKCICEY